MRLRSQPMRSIRWFKSPLRRARRRGFERAGSWARGLPASLDPNSLELVPGTIHEKLEGSVPSLANEEDLRQALEQAFDYRGDVSITRKDGTKIEGYIFDRSRWKRAFRQLRAVVAERWFSQDKNLLRRNRCPGFYRARYGCGQELGKLGAALLGKEGGGGDRYFAAAGEAGVRTVVSSQFPDLRP